MRPDNLRQSGDSDRTTNFYPRSFSRAALDQGSENGGTRCIGSSGKQAKVIAAEEASTSKKYLIKDGFGPCNLASSRRHFQNQISAHHSANHIWRPAGEHRR